MKKILNIYLWLSILCMAASCDTFENQTPPVTDESIKAIEGVWKINKATRNGLDITDLMDFSKFRIRFNQDNTYSIDNYLPFAVKTNGTWTLDDPQYPFNLSFTETGSASAITSVFDYPIVNGKRHIVLTFIPGCKNNIYTYSFVKTEN